MYQGRRHVVLKLSVVGFGFVLQHYRPLAETVAPPSLLIFHPLVALFAVISVTATVVNVGFVAVVLKVITLP